MAESAWHNKTRLDIVEFYNNKGYSVDTSHGEGTVPLYFEKAPFGCKSIVAMAKHWMVPIR